MKRREKFTHKQEKNKNRFDHQNKEDKINRKMIGFCIGIAMTFIWCWKFIDNFTRIFYVLLSCCSFSDVIHRWKWWWCCDCSMCCYSNTHNRTHSQCFIYMWIVNMHTLFHSLFHFIVELYSLPCGRNTMSLIGAVWFSHFVSLCQWKWSDEQTEVIAEINYLRHVRTRKRARGVRINTYTHKHSLAWHISECSVKPVAHHDAISMYILYNIPSGWAHIGRKTDDTHKKKTEFLVRHWLRKQHQQNKSTEQHSQYSSAPIRRTR